MKRVDALNEYAAFCRQDNGTVDIAEVSVHEAALQGAMILAKQARDGDRFSPSQLQEAAGPLQVPT